MLSSRLPGTAVLALLPPARLNQAQWQPADCAVPALLVSARQVFNQWVARQMQHGIRYSTLSS